MTTSSALTGGVATFNPTPSIERSHDVVVSVGRSVPSTSDVVGVPVGTKGAVPRQLGLDRTTLSESGFDAKVGQTLVVPRRDGATLVAVGVERFAQRLVSSRQRTPRTKYPAMQHAMLRGSHGHRWALPMRPVAARHSIRRNARKRKIALTTRLSVVSSVRRRARLTRVAIVPVLGGTRSCTACSETCDSWASGFDIRKLARVGFVSSRRNQNWK